MDVFGFIFGAIWFITGCGMVFLAWKGKVSNMLLGLLFLICGAVGIPLSFFTQLGGTLTGLIFITALLCLWAPLNIIYLSRKCQTVVYASCVDFNVIRARQGQSTYNPVFEYVYSEETYRIASPVGYSYKKIQQKYQTGLQYPVYINEKYPKQMIDDKKFHFMYVMLFIIGVILMGIYLYLLGSILFYPVNLLH